MPDRIAINRKNDKRKIIEAIIKFLLEVLGKDKYPVSLENPTKKNKKKSPNRPKPKGKIDIGFITLRTRAKRNIILYLFFSDTQRGG